MAGACSSKRKRGGRPKSEYWNEAEKIGKDKWKCNHCQEEFAGGATRIQEHINGEGNNIRKCHKYRANQGPHNGSSSPQEAVNTLNQLQADEIKLGDQIVEHDSAAFESKDIERAFFYPKGDPDAVCIRKRDIELLQPEKCINDNIIDFYIKYLKNKLPTDKQDRFHFFNCFFFPKLVDLGKYNPSIACDAKAAFQRVSNWTRKVNLFEKDYIFIPINYSLHWSLIVICHPAEVMTCYRDEEIKESPKEPCILHMDSRKGIHEDLRNVFQSYLCEEWKERHNNVRDDVSSKFLHLQFVPLELPQQQNAYDCGIFLLHYVERFLEQAPINFNLSMITKFSCWFPPPDASLKRSHIRKLLEAVEGDNKMIVGGSVNPQNNAQLSTLSGGDVENHAVNRGSNANDALTINKLLSDLTRKEDETDRQLQWLEFQGKKRKRQEVDDWLDKLKDLKKIAIDVKNSLHQSGSTNELPKPYKLNAELQDLLFIEKPWGWLGENVKKMWNLLEDEEVFIIGIDGMGGVGKTFLATHIKNEIKRNGTFKDVFWVTISHDFTIFKLQHHIADTIQVKLYGDEMTRATILTSELEKIEKTLLILDDVWEYIDLQKVGIPLKMNGIKLIITTRLKHVCRQMDCLPYNTITMHPLSHVEGEAWELFLLKHGHRGTPARVSCEILEYARSIVMKCDGLPFGISVMARTMKGKNDIHWWRHALNKLDKFEIGKEVLSILKCSYDNLIEKDVQKCFLQCALFPNDISKELWVMMLLESGLLNGKRSLQEINDEGRVIVDKLINHSLLLLDDGKLRMNGLVRNMACHILNENRTYMIKCNENLTKIPHIREWTADLEGVSLASNNIEEIAEGTSPNCPHLSIFILSCNSISHIPECFFTHMNSLTLLDLSYNDELTYLPKSLSKLRSLTSLVLRKCCKLKYIPPLGDLQALSRLDISCCDSILQVPEGLQNLINLKWLDLFQNKNSMMKLIPGYILPGLTNMQYLDLRSVSGIKVEDVKGMTMLECFAGSFLDQDNYNRYVQEIQDSGYGPQFYIIYFGKFNNATPDFFKDSIYVEFKRRSVWFGDCNGLPYSLPRDLSKLFVIGNNQWECLCAALSSNGSLSLRDINIQKCKKLESLFCVSCSLCTNIQNLKSLYLYYLDSLSVISKEGVAGRGVFSHLKEFHIKGCHKIETLLTPRIVPQLQNLQSISVSGCDSMEKIFAGDSAQLQNLQSISVTNCASMKEIFAGDSPQLQNLQSISVCFCASMKEIFAGDSPQLQNLQSISVSFCASMKEIFAGDSPQLQNLQSISVSSCPSMKEIFAGDSPQLQNLQSISVSFCASMKEIFAGDSPQLQNLQSISVSFCASMKEIFPGDSPQLQNLQSISVNNCVSMEEIFPGDSPQLQNLQSISISDCDSMEKIFPGDSPQLQNLQSISVSGCDSMEKIFAGDSPQLQSLQSISVSGCDSMEKIFAGDSAQLQNLQSISVTNCALMKEIFAGDSPQLQNLQSISVCFCASMKEIFAGDSPQLQNLQSISVSFCASMKEIFAGDSPQLQNLQSISVSSCPSMKEIFAGDSPQLQNLQSISVSFCASMKEIFAGDSPQLQNLLSISVNNCVSMKEIFPGDSPQLQNLQSISVNNCASMKEIFAGDSPQLQNLQSISVSFCASMKEIFPGDSPQLQNLQSISVNNCVSMEEIFPGDSPQLQNLQSISISDCDSMEKIFPGDSPQLQNLQSISVSGCDSMEKIFAGDSPQLQNLQSISVSGCDSMEKIFAGDSAQLQNLQSISVTNCASMKEIFAGDSPQLQNLQSISVCFCASMKEIFAGDSPQLQNLQSISVSFCASMKEIFAGDSPQLQNLQSISVSSCPSMKEIFAGDSPQLQNLQSISVSVCDSMEKIFAGDSPENIALPKLTKLELWNLPKLKTVCKEILICNFEDILYTFNCPNCEKPRIRVYV